MRKEKSETLYTSVIVLSLPFRVHVEALQAHQLSSLDGVRWRNCNREVLRNVYSKESAPSLHQHPVQTSSEMRSITVKQVQPAPPNHLQDAMATAALCAGIDEREADTCLPLREVGFQLGTHEVRDDIHKMVDIRHLSEELLFQELVAQLLVSQHLQGNGRLGSGELVQLRKLFQETHGRFKLLDTQFEVKDLEAEMRDLKVERIEEDAQAKERKGRVRYLESSEVLQVPGRSASAIGEELNLEGKLQLGEMELEEDRLENGEFRPNGGKRRTCFGVAIAKLDVKKSRNDLSMFTNLILEDLETSE